MDELLEILHSLIDAVHNGLTRERAGELHDLADKVAPAKADDPAEPESEKPDPAAKPGPASPAAARANAAPGT
jgi:hypothetical protein